MNFKPYPLENLGFVNNVVYWSIFPVGTPPTGAYELPSEYQGKPVRLTEQGAWSSAAYLTAIKVPQSFSGLGRYAFNNCPNLKYVLLEIGYGTNSMTGTYVFRNCTALTDLIVFNCKQISSWAFDGCTALTNIVLDSSLRSIVSAEFDGTFYGCTALKRLSVPCNVGAMVGPFINCTSLDTVLFYGTSKPGLYPLSQGLCFVGCTNLKTIVGFTGSTAETFANGSGLEFIPIKEWLKNDCISVFDSTETDFKHNGLHILAPTSSETTEELNGGYELSLTHPCDDEGRWKSLLEMNIIKAGGQLFRAYKKTTTMSADGKKQRIVNARHIWYDLLDPLMLSAVLNGLNGQQAVEYILEHMFVGGSGETFNYTFTGTSDITDIHSATYENISPVKCFLGADNSFVNTWGGELERDNFTFSINSRRGQDNAFSISYGADMTEIEEDVDYSNLITWLNATDNFGHTFAISYVDTLIPHHKVEAKQFQYDTNDYDRFIADASAYFDSVYTPEINYKVAFANLKNLPEYAEFIDLQRCELGDTGTIFNEPLGISTVQKVIKKTVDNLTGDVISIELGTVKRSIVRPLKFSNVLPADNLQSKVNAALKQQVSAMTKSVFTTHEALGKYTHQQLALFTHEQLGGNG